ncbi:aromatic ring-hydroxylating dioxygenase subunit alpha [bacterium]|nr:aromatic ring-hydroxylating dioxygenase subunit alpha [bacterium]
MFDSSTQIPTIDLDTVAKPISSARGMPGSTYTDPQLFSFERDKVLGKTWAGLAFASELPLNGSLLPVDFMGLPLLVTRTHEGDINVFHNVCSHRGMTLVSAAQDQSRGIRCPYHSWFYDLNGVLKATPQIGGSGVHELEDFSCAENNLKPVRCHLWMGVIFINLSADAEDFADFIGPLEERWAPFMGPAGVSQLTVPSAQAPIAIEVTANWKLAVENYCEAYHLPWVHPSLNSYSPLDQHYNIVAAKNMSGQGSYAYTLCDIAGTELPQFEHWPEDKLRHAEYISLYPNVLLGLQVDHAFAMILQPVAVDKTIEKLQLSYLADGAESNHYQLSRDAITESWQQVFGEDIFAVEGMQKARHSPGFTGGVFSPIQDVPSHHFHGWVAQQYQAGQNQ